MQLPGSRGLMALVLACGVGFAGVPALAATPTFSITATNVTLPSNGDPGTSQFTLVSVNGYSGKLVVNSQYSGGNMNAKPPNCGIHTAPLYTLSANGSVTGTLACYPYGKVVPVVELHPPAGFPYRAPVLGLAIAGWLVFRRRMRAAGARWFAVFLLSAISVASVAGCGGNGLSGTYPFTITATDTVTSASVSTSMMVTVP